MKNTIDIYTDSSHYLLNNTKKHIFGYAGVILGEKKDYVLKGTITRKTIRNYFKLNCNIDTLGIEHGELIAIAKSLFQFRFDSENIRIFSDSLNGLERIQRMMDGDPIKKNGKKYDKIVDYIITLINKIKSNGGSVELFWVKGHANCYGNEIADVSAKDMFVPKLRKKKMSPKQKKTFNSLPRKGKNNRHNYRQKLLSDYSMNRISSMTDDFFFEKEVNEFKEYKSTLTSKSEPTPNFTALDLYTLTIKTMIQMEVDKYKSLFNRIKNGNPITKYL